MKEHIRRRFDGNLARVNSLTELYAGLALGQGRRPVEQTDLLRAAVVLLHATLEDLLRSVLEWRLPEADPQHLKAVPILVYTKPEAKVDLAELARGRGRSVQEIIQQSVSEHLSRSNYNHPGEIKAALVSIGLDEALAAPYSNSLSTMMKRRHLIVHRADRNENTGRGHHGATPISKSDVDHWRDVVEQFGGVVLNALPN